MPQTRAAAIVGIHEYPLRVVGPGVSALQIKAASAARALEDAGLSWADVDAVYDTGSHQSVGGLGISEYFGINPKLIDNTAVGGTSYEFQANHAASMIAAGKCEVALLTYGSTAHSDRRAIGTGGAVGGGTPNPATNMESSWGQTLIANYAMVKNRHMHQYGTTNEQFAHISIATRKHAMRNPEAVKAMTDLEFVGIRELTVEDVVDSRMIAWPLRLLECCMISDGGGRGGHRLQGGRGQLRQEAGLGDRRRKRRPSTARTAETSPSARGRSPDRARSPTPASHPMRSTY